jgi:uncharacterized surface protein with fasciclin (FAS1) repeats/serine/threonine protein kinase
VSQRIPLIRIGKLEKISQGGQGVVYRAPSATTHFAKSMVYKEYKRPTLAALDVKVLDSLPEFLEALPYKDGARLISLAAWPCRIVEDAGNATGFLMPSIPDEFYIELWTNKSTPTRVTAEFQHLLNDSQVLAMRFRGSVPTQRQRYELIQQVASALAFLHEHDVCVGDISPKNILYALSPVPAVYFIDCDAMRVRGTTLSPQVETPGWEVPPGEEKATIYSDRYKLGLLALRILVGDQETVDLARLPAAVPTELRRVVAETLKGKVNERPDFKAWESALTPAIAITSNQQSKVPYKPPTQTEPPPQHSSVPPVATRARQSQWQQAAPPPLQPATPVQQKKSTSAAPWLWVVAGLIGVAIVGALLSNPSSRDSADATGDRGAPSASGLASTPMPAPSDDAVAGQPQAIGSGCADYAQMSGGALLGDALANSPDLTTLANALSGGLNPQTNFVRELNSGQFTVFAPSNAAFAKIDSGTIDILKRDAPLLNAVLTYHIVPGQRDPEEVVGRHPTVQGSDLIVSGSGDAMKVNAANVVCGGIRTANAVIYVIDFVLMPPAS